jgi:hypothetical protein
MAVDIQKNSYEVLRVQQTTYGGYDLVDIRVFYRRKPEDAYKPSPKGVSFRTRLLAPLIQALCEVRDGMEGEQDEAPK